MHFNLLTHNIKKHIYEHLCAGVSIRSADTGDKVLRSEVTLLQSPNQDLQTRLQTLVSQ